MQNGLNLVPLDKNVGWSVFHFHVWLTFSFDNYTKTTNISFSRKDIFSVHVFYFGSLLVSLTERGKIKLFIKKKNIYDWYNVWIV